jgi:hypothetical protein
MFFYILELYANFTYRELVGNLCISSKISTLLLYLQFHP